MSAKRLEFTISAALDRNEIALKEVTRAQYASQLRDFYRWLEERSARHLRFESVRRYVEDLPSGWARRRAVSALGSLYRYFRRPDIGERLRECGFGRPKRATRHSLPEHLRSLGWSIDALRRLRWSDVLKSYVLGGRICNVGRSRYRLDRRARTDLRSMLCRRFPTSQRMLGKAVCSGHVFTASDMPDE